MTLWVSIVPLLVWSGAALAAAQLQWLPEPEPRRVFGGGTRSLPVRLHNSGDEIFRAETRVRMFQIGSATAALWAETPWKELCILPGQTVLESTTLEFPAVRARTRFRLQWCAGTNRVLGWDDVWVYPTNLLAELGALAGRKPIGVLDPQNELKPLFKELNLEFADLEETGFDSFQGALAIVGPFSRGSPLLNDLAAKVAALAHKGAAVVWLHPPSDAVEPKTVPTFYAVTLGAGTVVVAQQQWVAMLTEDPWAQLRVLHLARYALRPEPLRLPTTNP